VQLQAAYIAYSYYALAESPTVGLPSAQKWSDFCTPRDNKTSDKQAPLPSGSAQNPLAHFFLCETRATERTISGSHLSLELPADFPIPHFHFRSIKCRDQHFKTLNLP
jgi:hypothetical protein